MCPPSPAIARLRVSRLSDAEVEAPSVETLFAEAEGGEGRDFDKAVYDLFNTMEASDPFGFQCLGAERSADVHLCVE